MATYTTAALVRKRAENLDATLADADINAYIETAEGMLNAMMGVSFVATFTVAKHGVVRAAAEAWAAMAAISFNMVGFTSLSEATMMLEQLRWEWSQAVLLLQSKTYVAYLESL